MRLLTSATFITFITLGPGFITLVPTLLEPSMHSKVTDKDSSSLNITLLTMVFYQLTTRAQALAMKAMGATLEHIQHITEIKR